MIQAPAWCKDAVPTLKGWKHPRRNEILKPIKLTQEQIDEWHGITSAPEIKEPPAQMGYVDPDDVISDLNEDGEIDELESMTKSQLELYGREYGIELDRRKNKKTMIEDLRAHFEGLSVLET